MDEPKRKTRHVVFDKWRFDIEEYEAAGIVNVNGKKTPVGKGFVPNGGIVLKNVYHGGYRLAYDMGIVGVWIYPGKKAVAAGFTKPKYLRLGAPDFRQLDDKNKIADTKSAKNFDVEMKKAHHPFGLRPYDALPNNFSVFTNNVVGELKVNWVSCIPVFGKESGSLLITQKFLFTSYGTEPAHEPSGGLSAARLHPLIEVHYPNKDDGFVESIRVDYRLYLNLDTYWGGKFPPFPGFTNSEEKKTISELLNNQSGVFRDEENAIPLSITKNNSLDVRLSVADVVFSAAEKPIKYEIIANGLVGEDTEKTYWDNIHWWGSNGGHYVLPSTPGAFHAVHLHWRWGKSLQLPPNDPVAPTQSGKKQFVGEGKGGILADPRIDLQKIEFAIVKNENLPVKIYGSNMEKHGTAKFEDFFKAKRGAKPSNIENGDDLVLYYSVNVNVPNSSSKKLQRNTPFEGVFFIHGLFFAHEIETGSIRTGSTKSFYENPTEDLIKQEWNRNPSKL
jgi:hypothetical protein